jgi:ElaB/YqjD/DUF883 family membrane-anchored ribosome-binding protein
MVDKNMSDAAQNAAASAAQATDLARDYAARGMGAAREYAGAARDYANKGYDAASEYAKAGIDVAGRVNDNLTEFVRNEPWIAVAAAFAVGYLAARIILRLSI